MRCARSSLAWTGVLVRVDSIVDGRNRRVLDALLHDVASRGVWVSTHLDVILKMGVKEVLYRTKHLGWGINTQLYRDVASLHGEFPSRLRSAGPRVLKQNRGNGGQSVWKVEGLDDATVECCTRIVAACPKSCHSAISSIAVRSTLLMVAASSASACPMADPLLHGGR
jgi:hypothetical protein